MGDNKGNIKKNTETLTYASNEDRLKVDTENMKYMLLFPHQTVGQNHATSYIYFKNVAQLQYQKFD
jgi:hypothetical protein